MHFLEFGCGESSDFSTTACQEGDMDLTRGRLGKDNDELNTQPRRMIKLENSQLRPQGNESDQSECWWGGRTGLMDEQDFNCGAGGKIATWDPWRLTIIMSILNANFGKNKQFAWAYPAGENSMNKDVGGQVHGVCGEPYVDGMVGAWGVCILTLTLLDLMLIWGK